MGGRERKGNGAVGREQGGIGWEKKSGEDNIKEPIT